MRTTPEELATFAELGYYNMTLLSGCLKTGGIEIGFVFFCCFFVKISLSIVITAEGYSFVSC